jgi:prepilin-type N-terminal cleavage/methylation domain-containing protein
MIVANSPERRGFSLIELMVYIVLMAVFASVLIPFCHRVLITMHDSQKVTIDDARLDQAMNDLRRDVWGAAAMQSPDARSLVLRSAEGRSTTWSFAAAGTASRVTSPKSRQDWAELPPGITLSVNGALVTVIVPDHPHTRGGTITMISVGQSENGASK